MNKGLYFEHRSLILIILFLIFFLILSWFRRRFGFLGLLRCLFRLRGFFFGLLGLHWIALFHGLLGLHWIALLLALFLSLFPALLRSPGLGGVRVGVRFLDAVFFPFVAAFLLPLAQLFDVLQDDVDDLHHADEILQRDHIPLGVTEDRPLDPGHLL
jgi:hypothetical protein